MTLLRINNRQLVSFTLLLYVSIPLFFSLSQNLFSFRFCARLNPSILDIEEFFSIDRSILAIERYWILCSPMCSRLSQNRNVSVRLCSSHNAPPAAPYYFPSFRLPRSYTFSRTIIEASVSSAPTLFSHNGLFLSYMR